MYLIEKTMLDYEKELIDLRQSHLKTCFKYEQHIKDLNQIILEMKHTFYKVPDCDDHALTEFYDENY